jgi:hypothetical protein
MHLRGRVVKLPVLYFAHYITKSMQNESENLLNVCLRFWAEKVHGTRYTVQGTQELNYDGRRSNGIGKIRGLSEGLSSVTIGLNASI